MRRKLTTADWKPWTTKELQFLRDNYPSKGGHYVSIHLGRSLKAIYHKAKKLGTPAVVSAIYVVWTPEKDAELKEKYPFFTNKHLAEMLEVSIHSLNKRAVRLKLYKQKLPRLHGAILKGPAWTNQLKQLAEFAAQTLKEAG